jgi:hypothetical protein
VAAAPIGPVFSPSRHVRWQGDAERIRQEPHLLGGAHPWPWRGRNDAGHLPPDCQGRCHDPHREGRSPLKAESLVYFLSEAVDHSIALNLDDGPATSPSVIHPARHWSEEVVKLVFATVRSGVTLHRLVPVSPRS